MKRQMFLSVNECLSYLSIKGVSLYTSLHSYTGVTHAPPQMNYLATLSDSASVIHISWERVLAIHKGKMKDVPLSHFKYISTRQHL